MSYTLHHGDCLAHMATMPENSVDTIITDPPYNVVIDYGENHSDKKDNYMDWCKAWFEQCTRISRHVWPGLASEKASLSL